MPPSEAPAVAFQCRFPADVLEAIDADRHGLSRNAWLLAAATAKLPPAKRTRKGRTAAPESCAGCGALGGSHQRGCARAV